MVWLGYSFPGTERRLIIPPSDIPNTSHFQREGFVWQGFMFVDFSSPTLLPKTKYDHLRRDKVEWKKYLCYDFLIKKKHALNIHIVDCAASVVISTLENHHAFVCLLGWDVVFSRSESVVLVRVCRAFPKVDKATATLSLSYSHSPTK